MARYLLNQPEGEASTPAGLGNNFPDADAIIWTLTIALVWNAIEGQDERFNVRVDPRRAPSLGDIVYVQLPDPGTAVEAGEAFGEVESTKSVSEIYAPLSNRLGMQNFKSELEDLSFKYLEPDAYTELVSQMHQTKRERDKYITEVCKTLSGRLAEQGFAADVTGRAKHLYSVYRKMQAQQSDVDGVHDLIGFRVVVESVSDCYAALGSDRDHGMVEEARE